MTHEEIRSRLMGALDRTLDPDERDEVERHVAGCGPCRIEQAELHRLRAEVDRADRDANASPRRLLPIPPGGLVRLGILAAATIAAGLLLTSGPRLGGSGPRLGEGARRGGSAAAPGAMSLRSAGRETPLLPGREVAVPEGAHAVAALGAGLRVALLGPARGEAAPGAWRPLAGRLVAQASAPEGAAPSGGLRLEAGPRGAIVLRQGTLAVWETFDGASSGLSACLLEGEASWEGPGGGRMAPGLVLVLGAAAPTGRACAPARPDWVALLRAALLEDGAGEAIPVRVVPD